MPFHHFKGTIKVATWYVDNFMKFEGQNLINVHKKVPARQTIRNSFNSLYKNFKTHPIVKINSHQLKQ